MSPTPRGFRLFASVLVLVGLVAPALAQVTTGQIDGIVTDEIGEPLVGATVKASSPELQGTRQATTGADGRYVFPVLPTGPYVLEFSSPGRATVRLDNVLVRLGATTTESVQLKTGELVETVSVTASSPLINAKTADTGLNIDKEMLDTLPVATRNFQELAKLVPSVTSVELNTSTGERNGLPSIRGEGQYGDNYLIDGLTVRDPGDKSTATPLPYDAIDEVQIVTDGFSPEYGQALGGLINAITKSGSNALDGEIAYLFSSDALTADFERTILGTPEEFDDSTAYGNLGGPIVKDKLWYFVTYNHDDGSDTFVEVQKPALFLPQGTTDARSDAALGKLTWALNPKHNLSANYTWRDTANRDVGADFATPEAREYDDITDTRLRVNYQALFSASSILEVKFGNVDRELETGPMTNDFGPGAYNIESYSARINNTERLSLDDRKRDDYAAIFTQFWNPGGRGGSHEFKAGIEYHEPEQVSADVWTGLDEDVHALDADPDAPGFGVDPDTFNEGATFSFIEEFNPSPILVPAVLIEYRTLPAQRNRSEEWGIFFQDRMEFGRWNIMLGARADRQEAFNDIDEVFAEYGFSDAISPRAYVTWDVAGNGKNIVKTGWGRFYDVNGTRFGEFANTRGSFTYRNYGWRADGVSTDEDFRLHIDDSSLYDLHNPANWSFLGEQSPEANPISYDEVEGPARVDRFLLEYDRLILNDYAFKARYVSSKARDLIDDVNHLDLDEGPLHFVVQNTDLKRRDYDSLEFEFNGTPSPNVAFNASWVHSASKGTSPGQFETDGFVGTSGSGNDIGVFLDQPESNPQFWCDFYGPTCVPPSWVLTDPQRDYNNDDVVNQFDRDLQIQTLFEGLGSIEGDDGWYGYLPYSIDDLIKFYGRFTIEQWADAYVTGFLQWASGYHTQRRGFQQFYGSYLTFSETGSFEFDGACTGFADCEAVLVQSPIAGESFSMESGLPRGSLENDSFWTLDLAIGKVWNVGRGMGVEGRLEAFNVTDNQVPLAIQDRAVSEFGEPLRRQYPRTFRVFARLTF